MLGLCTMYFKHISHWKCYSHFWIHNFTIHYDDVTMSEIASRITSLMIVYSTVHSVADQSKHQSSASLAFVREIHRGPVNFPHKWPVTRKMFPFDDVIMSNVDELFWGSVCALKGNMYNDMWSRITKSIISNHAYLYNKKYVLLLYVMQYNNIRYKNLYLKSFRNRPTGTYFQH